MTATVTTLAVPIHPALADFSISPSTQQFTRPAGTVIAGSFRVPMRHEHGSTFHVRVEDVRQTSTGSLTFPPVSAARFSASRWVQPFPLAFPGLSQGAQPITFVVRIPANAPPGDHVAALVVERTPKGATVTHNGGVTTSVGVTLALAMRLTVRVEGTLITAVHLGAIQAPSIAGGPPIVTEVSVSNTGNTFIDFARTNSKLAIFDGATVEAALPLTGLLFPDETRSFRLAWNSPPLIGHFEVKAQVDLDGRNYSSSSDFYVLPWRQVGAGLLVALACIVLIGGRRGRRRRIEPG